jgi:nucleoside-diphosphate-sugar epimerase
LPDSRTYLEFVFHRFLTYERILLGSATMTFNPTAGSLALPQGSLILITGSTGYIATHIIHETLLAGYEVRGTARSAQKAKDDEAFHDNPKYHCAVVPDMFVEGALDEALKGVNGVIHTSSPTDMNPDPSVVIPPLVKHVECVLVACTKVSSVKRFVYTSSATAATLPIQGKPGHLDENSWNDEAVKVAWTPPHVPEKGYAVYGASKTEAERALWRFVAEKKPGFVVNTILPDTTMGRVLNGRAGPTGGLVTDLYLKGEVSGYVPSRTYLPLYYTSRVLLVASLTNRAEYMVNVVDNARVHLLALSDASVENERIFAWDEIFTWNGLIDIVSRLRPNAAARLETVRLKDEAADLTTVDNKLGGELLRKWYGQDGDGGRGWAGLETTVKENLEGVPELEL